ncbi:putative CRA domain-containing protein [Septoria linicola]|nr:putative CRA domain-containing protein [Septoria linicola]
MRPIQSFDSKVEEKKPSKSDINWVIMDYLVSEGYPAAAEKFAQETNLGNPDDLESIRERVAVRNAIHSGNVEEAIELINEIDHQILDHNQLLHFNLLQLQLIELIRGIIVRPASSAVPTSEEFRPALDFATEQLAPKAPTEAKYQEALQRTMALMIFSPDKMQPEFKELLDLRLREKVATSVNKAILESRGQRSEAKIRRLVRGRAWAESLAHEVKVDLPSTIPIGLDAAETAQVAGDAMVQ